MKERKNIMSIAGFDPTGGAGVLADVKTFEANKCRGFAVITANTVQTEDSFIAINWVDKGLVKEQLAALLKQYKFDVIKIGLIHSSAFLVELVGIIKKEYPKIKIIWDPVLSASAGMKFEQNLDDLKAALKLLFLITPNRDEIIELSGNPIAEEGATELSDHCYLFLKGGHNSAELGKDILFYKGETRNFLPKNDRFFPKHGSGCVLSSAIAANINRGYPLQKALLRGKRYVEFYLKSTPGLLGYHK